MIVKDCTMPTLREDKVVFFTPETVTNELQAIRTRSQYQRRWSVVKSSREMRRLFDICGLKNQQIIRNDAVSVSSEG